MRSNSGEATLQADGRDKVQGGKPSSTHAWRYGRIDVAVENAGSEDPVGTLAVASTDRAEISHPSAQRQLSFACRLT
jgi:hypothetical protein